MASAIGRCRAQALLARRSCILLFAVPSEPLTPCVGGWGVHGLSRQTDLDSWALYVPPPSSSTMRAKNDVAHVAGLAAWYEPAENAASSPNRTALYELLCLCVVL